MKNVGIFTHKGCDLDALCSTETMAEILETYYSNLKVVPIIESSYLDEKVKGNRKHFSIEEAKNIHLDYALVCDTNEYDRVYGIELFEQVPVEKRYLIDHHTGNRVELEVPDNNKLIDSKAAATCQIIAEKLLEKELDIPSNMAYNLYIGIASDTSEFNYNVTDKTVETILSLPLTSEEKQNAIISMVKLTLKQEYLLSKIETVSVPVEGLKVYKLLEPENSKDTSLLVNHNDFHKKVAPTKENPVSCFIIGIGNDYIIKFKKLGECPINILEIATECNGGGHETMCVGRLYNDTFENVIATVLSEYEAEKEKSSHKEELSHKIQK